MKKFWEVADRISAALTILTPLGALVVWILARDHLLGPHHAEVGVVITAVSLTIVGVGCVVSGAVMRRSVYAVFAPNRGRTGTATLLVGTVLLAASVTTLTSF